MNSNWSYSPEMPNLGQNPCFFVPCDLEIWQMTLCFISYPLVNSNWSHSPETTNLGQIRRFLEPCDLEIWQMALKNNRAPLLCYFKLCASFRSHWWIKTGVAVRKRPIWMSLNKANLRDLIAATRLVISNWIQIVNFSTRVAMNFDG